MIPAGTARAKPSRPPSRNFSSLVIFSGRALHSVARVMKKARPWVISSKAVTTSPETILRISGWAWSDSRWCDHTVQETTSSTSRAARAMFCMKSFLPVISVASRYQVPATKISTRPSAIRSRPHQNQFL